jgi:hypothetical protein
LNCKKSKDVNGTSKFFSLGHRNCNSTEDNNIQKLRLIVPIDKNYEENKCFSCPCSELCQRGAPLLRTGVQPGTMYSGPLRDSGNESYNNTYYSKYQISYSERDFIIPCGLKSSFKTGLQISLERSIM